MAEDEEPEEEPIHSCSASLEIAGLGKVEVERAGGEPEALMAICRDEMEWLIQRLENGQISRRSVN